MHALSTALFDRPAYKKVVAHGIVLGNDGLKMSKSKGNYPNVNEVFDRDGSDAMRWFLMSSPILRGAGVEPILEPADIDERSLEASLAGHPPADIVAALATAKAEKVAERYPTEPVIGGDSMLLLDGELQGKPLTEEATIERWHQQAGRTAEPADCCNTGEVA